MKKLVRMLATASPAAVLLGLAGIFMIPAPALAQSPCSVKKNEFVIMSNAAGWDLSFLTGTSAPPGTLLDNAYPATTNISGIFDCGLNKIITSSTATPTVAAVPGIMFSHPANGSPSPIYPTGVPGIGFSFYIGPDNGNITSPFVPSGTQIIPLNPPVYNTGYSVRIFFLITGALENGTYTVPKQQVGELRLFTSTDPQLATTVPIYLDTTTFKISTRSCKLDTRSQSVKLPDVSATEFQGVQSVSSTSGSFNINLSNCSQGIPISATLTDASNSGNRGDILGLSSHSTATGVGLKLYKNGESTALSYGPDSSASNNPGRWNIRTSSGTTTSFSIPFVVRYVQTGAQVTPGSVHAVSTITLSYQ